MAKQNIITFGYNMHSVVTCRGEVEYHSRLAQKLGDPKEVLKHVGIFLNDFIMRKNDEIFHPYHSIIKLELDFKIKGNF